MTFSGPYEGIQRPYGRILAGNEKKSEHWLPTGVEGPSQLGSAWIRLAWITTYLGTALLLVFQRSLGGTLISIVS